MVYSVLSFGYKFYLQFSDGSKFYPDYITHLVSKHTELIINTFGYNTEVLPHPDEPSMKVIINGNYLARIIEGCNGVSILILFVSFIIAFSGQAKTTFFYILYGGILIYSINLFRIVILTLGLYHYPQYEDILHTVVFPGIIYGMIFLLWIFWVNRFSKLKQNHD